MTKKSKKQLIKYGNNCIDCGKKIWYGSIRCKSCSKKNIRQPKHSKKMTRINNPNYKTGKFTKKIGYICPKCGKRKCLASKQCKKCMIKSYKIRYSGRGNPRFGKLAKNRKGIYYKCSYMRSSYELAFAKYCIKNRIKYRYEFKTFDLGDTTYTPDFYLPETDEYIEIKGWWRDYAIKKFKLFRKKYPKIKIKVLMRKKLKELGIMVI